MAQMRAHLQAQAEASTVAVWPENWHAWTVFQLMRTQWRAVAGMGGVLWMGLDYAALEEPLRIARRSMPRRVRQPRQVVMQQLRTLERHAVELRNAQ